MSIRHHHTTTEWHNICNNETQIVSRELPFNKEYRRDYNAKADIETFVFHREFTLIEWLYDFNMLNRQLHIFGLYVHFGLNGALPTFCDYKHMLEYMVKYKKSLLYRHIKKITHAQSFGSGLLHISIDLK